MTYVDPAYQCKQHPSYKAVRMPRVACLCCWHQYVVSPLRSQQDWARVAAILSLDVERSRRDRQAARDHIERAAEQCRQDREREVLRDNTRRFPS